MTYEQITGLLDRGFSPDQIMQLQSADQGGTADQEEQPAQEENKTPEEKPGEDQAGTPSAETDQTISEMQKTIDDLKKQLQAQNIRTASVPVIPGNDDSAVENVLASMIRPPFEDKDNKGGNPNVR